MAMNRLVKILLFSCIVNRENKKGHTIVDFKAWQSESYNWVLRRGRRRARAWLDLHKLSPEDARMMSVPNTPAHRQTTNHTWILEPFFFIPSLNLDTLKIRNSYWNDQIIPVHPREQSPSLTQLNHAHSPPSVNQSTISLTTPMHASRKEHHFFTK